MNAHTESVTFTEWKDRFNSGESVEGLALEGLDILDGLAYGRVDIRSHQGSRLLLAHFVVNAECQARTAAHFEAADPHNAALEQGAHVPEGPVVGLFWDDDRVEEDHPINLQYYDPRSDAAQGIIHLMQAGPITINPYPGGYHDGELPSLICPTPEILDAVFAATPQ